jgi:hypothetical protein
VKEWTKSIDLSLLYQLGQLSQRLKAKAKAAEDESLLREAELLGLIVARVNGGVANLDLTALHLPSLPVSVDPIVSVGRPENRRK